MDDMKLLIIEDDPVHRAFLREAIESALPECGMVLEAADGRTGEKIAREHDLQNIIMDLQMQHGTGVDAARTIWRERPDTAILFWTNYADEAYVRGVSRIVPAGAAYGYLLKSASEDRLRLALRSIFVESQCVIDKEIRGVQQKAHDRAMGFTDGEYEILLDIALGLTDRAIASRRRLSLRSVQNRLQHLYEKLGVGPGNVAGEEAVFNLRARAVTVAVLRKLLNRSAVEQAEQDLQRWLARHQQQGGRDQPPGRSAPSGGGL
jgi:DNA-binding NarL/FixJ family response regulator